MQRVFALDAVCAPEYSHRDRCAFEQVDRLKDYFRADLSRKLLYPQEKRQFKKLVASTKCDVCDVYGPEHLLRLFTTLPVC